jgi:hypothetical protein
MMRKTVLLSILCVLLSCSNNDTVRRNPFLIDIGFQTTINTNLPQFSNLNFPGNFVVVPNIGIRGVVIYNLGNSQLFAYELSDPNHAPSACSTLNIQGITAVCPCTDDINEYNIITGQPTAGGGIYGMRAYRVTRSNNIITVSN